MFLKDFWSENGKIGGVPDVIVYSERKDGLYVIHERKKIERRIGNFVLRLVKENRETASEDTIRRYNFKVYRIEKRRVIENKTGFYIYANERASNKEVAARLKDVVLEQDRISLEYLDLYVTYLINNGIKSHSHRLVDDEMTIEKVKKYLILFAQLIHGKENEFIENDYDYSKNGDFYEEKNICGNKDLFLYNRKWHDSYKKIGYEHNQFWYIHLPDLIKFMESENRYQEKLPAQTINIGLHKLGIMALPDIKNTQNVKARIKTGEKDENGEEIEIKISMNLTKIYTEKLLKLAYPDAEVEPEEPEKPQKEESSNDAMSDNKQEEDNRLDLSRLSFDNNNKSAFKGIIDDKRKKHKKKSYDDYFNN